MAFSTPSSSPMRPSVSFCSSTSARCSSSEDGLALGLQLAQVLHRVAAHVADRHASLLGEVAHDLDELAPALLGQLGHGQAHEVAVVGGVQADVGLVDRLLDRLDRGLVVGLHGDQARLGRGDRRELVQRGHRAVVVDHDAVQQRRARAAGAHRRELVLGGLHRLGHPLARVLEQFVDQVLSCHRPLLAGVDTSVPTRSPEIIRAMLVLVVHVEDVQRHRRSPCTARARSSPSPAAAARSPPCG